MAIEDSHNIRKLHAVSIGLAFGIVEGLYILLFAWASWVAGYGANVMLQASTLLYGYDSSFLGGVIGGLYGFVDGFIFGFAAAFLYNHFIGYFSHQHVLVPRKKKKVKKSKAV